ncbi:hypothetical protein N7516_008949 [Penicillium verrucosum]|uniref:uncharacterized protein n=1 Tax=Penicillium verrucosum TaxID=60171 RepID=UPI0025450865|nr:uncharacterized protein N7516_008949 [Penicillium verrucosum]KAJ5927176.1 hypothetical protein N7516_008949 [Penicillium verrucosum]
MRLKDNVTIQHSAPQYAPTEQQPSPDYWDCRLLVVSGVNPPWGDQIDTTVLVRSGPVRLMWGTTT